MKPLSKITSLYRRVVPPSYSSRWTWPFRYLKNIGKRCEIIGVEEMKRRKRSDTLFILGSSKTILDVSDGEWETIRAHDSVGLSYFILHEFVPTYLHLEAYYESEWRAKQAEMYKRRADSFAERGTVFLVSDRAWRKGFRPKLEPDFFCDGQTVCLYPYPGFVRVPGSRPFKADDFENGRYMYRGSLNLMLYFAILMEYKRVVLVGCDMLNGVYFFEGHPEVAWLDERIELIGYQSSHCERERMKYIGLYQTKGKHDYATTVKAFDEFVLKPAGIELFSADAESALHPEVAHADIADFA